MVQEIRTMEEDISLNKNAVTTFERAVQKKSDTNDPMESGHRWPISTSLLSIGFIAGITLAACCMLFSAFYLYKFLTITSSSLETLLNDSERIQRLGDTLRTVINARLVLARLTLLSCGTFVGMAFGFLGFALFLIGVKGEMDANASFESYRVKFARLSPGVFIITCASVLIGICVTHPTPFDSIANVLGTTTVTQPYTPPITDDTNKP